MAHPLVEEATKKAAIAWVAAGGEPPVALWCMGMDGALWLVTGPGEQAAPGLTAGRDAAGRDAAGQEALVTLRGDHGGRIITWPAAVARVDPDSDEWTETVPQLAGKRLNAPHDAASITARWAAECTVWKLIPAAEPVEAGRSLPDTSLPDTSQAEPPRDTPARRQTRAPFRLHRVRRR